MAELRVPKLNNNDAEYLLVEWLVSDGARVGESDVVVLLETSKATEELTADSSGVLRHKLSAGTWCHPDDVIATINATGSPDGTGAVGAVDAVDAVDTERTGGLPTAGSETVRSDRALPGTPRAGTAQPDTAQPAVGRTATADGTEPLITAPARALIDELGIDLEHVKTLGIPVVRRADIEHLTSAATGNDHRYRGSGAGWSEDRSEGPVERASRGPQAKAQRSGLRETARPPSAAPVSTTAGEPLPAGREEHRLPRVQRAVARSVELSHQTIPAAYAVVRMDLGPALEHARARTREIRRPVGLAEVFVQAVAGLRERFPLFFATIDGTRALLAEAPNIGVTVDVGEGLYVPVVHDAASRTTRDIATTLMKHRLAASTGEFKEGDLSGANFVVTLHTEHGVVLAIPFVFPGTVCALAVPGPRDGTLADIGLAYDHRLINGRDAALFLNALKATVEGLT